MARKTNAETEAKQRNCAKTTAKQKGKTLLWHPRQNRGYLEREGVAIIFTEALFLSERNLESRLSELIVPTSPTPSLVPKCINMNNNVVLGIIINALSERP